MAILHILQTIEVTGLFLDILLLDKLNFTGESIEQILSEHLLFPGPCAKLRVQAWI